MHLPSEISPNNSAAEDIPETLICDREQEFKEMGEATLKYLLAVAIVVAVILLGANAFCVVNTTATVKNNAGVMNVKSDSAIELGNAAIQDRAPSSKDIAEAQAAIEAREQARLAEERRLAEEAAARQKAAEEAERAAREAASKTISTTPGEGEYSDVLMVGDSIMVVSSWSINDYLPGVNIDACSGRALEFGGPGEGGGPEDGVLDHIRAVDASQYSRYVIGTGNNDGGGMDMDSAEEIVSLLAGHEIWFVTEFVSNNPNGTNNTNATIEELCAKYPNVHKIDWCSVVSENQAEFLGNDNCHPQNQTATNAYAGLVKSALDYQAG